MTDPADVAQLSALASILRAEFGALVAAEREVEAAGTALAVALGIGQDGRCELDAIEVAAAGWLTTNVRLRTLAAALAALLGDAG